MHQHVQFNATARARMLGVTGGHHDPAVLPV